MAETDKVEEFTFVEKQRGTRQMRMVPGFYAETDLIDRVDRQCQEVGIKRSQFVREAMEEKLGRPITGTFIVPKHLRDSFSVLELLGQMLELTDGDTELLYLDYRSRMSILFGGWTKARNNINVAIAILQNYGMEILLEEDVSEITVPGTTRTRMDKRGFSLHFPTPVSSKTYQKLLVDIKKDIEETGNIRM